METVKNFNIATNTINDLFDKDRDTLDLARKVFRAENIFDSNYEESPPTVLVVGYSPTGGGHTARTLNIVEQAMKEGSLPEKSVVVFHVPPHWEGTPRPELLTKLADKLVTNNIDVKFIESEKPVYGYLDPKTGGSDDPKILERIALAPLRGEKYKFLHKYYPQKDSIKDMSSIHNYKLGDSIEELTRMSANDLMNDLTKKYDKKNIVALSDMAPDLMKAAKNNGILKGNRVDQGNHALLLEPDNNKKNHSLENAVLAKVLGGRGEKISHIALGGKNTLIGALTTAEKLGISKSTSLKEGKQIINKLLFSAAINANEITNKFDKNDYSAVLKGNAVKQAEDIKNIVYIYAHKKTPIIANHILKQVNNNHADYKNTAFIFCGKDAIPGFNAMHIGYLADAHAITTAGAGTSGEFNFLHKHAGAESSLLILPIEGHNEQEAIADSLCKGSATEAHMVRLHLGENLEDGHSIDELVGRKTNNHRSNEVKFDKLLDAISDKNTYVKQSHDILFAGAQPEEEAQKLQNIQQQMYNDPNLKATRKYLKIIFQIFNFISSNEDETFPMGIKFKKDSPVDITFNDINDIRNLFNDNDKLHELLKASDKEKINDLPCLSDVKKIINSSEFLGASNMIDEIKIKIGHHMTTGF